MKEQRAEQWQIETAEISFDPPLYKKPKEGRREVFLTTDTGRILTGIRAHFLKTGSLQIDIPLALATANRPEKGNPKASVGKEAGGVLRHRIRKQLRSQR